MLFMLSAKWAALKGQFDDSRTDMSRKTDYTAVERNRTA